MSIAETGAALRTTRVHPPFEPSRFAPPGEPRHYVARPRLTDLLEDLADYPVTALVSPAGTGKTQAASAWVRETARACAWLRLDAGDCEPAQLWRSVAEALGDEPASAGRVGRLRPVGKDRTATDASPLTLVLDDVQVLDGDDRAVAALESLVRDRPADIRLLLLSRRRLPLPNAGLRAAGTLADVPADVLRFSDTESEDLARVMAPEVPEVPLDRAAGWAAALRLWGLSVRSEPQAAPVQRRSSATTRFDRLVDEYVRDDVLRDEPAELVSLLTSTAVLRRMNDGLAEALSGRSEAGTLLERAEARGIVTPDPQDAGWFSAHPLVRETLGKRLDRKAPGELAEQHARAARWFGEMGDDQSAVEHWLSAGRPSEAFRVVAGNAVGLLAEGRLGGLTADINRARHRLGDADASGPPVARAWCELLVGDPEFVDTVAEAELAGDDQAGTRDPLLDVLVAASASWRGDWHEGETVVEAALETMGHGGRRHPIGRFGWNLVALGAALHERWNDDDPLLAASGPAVTGDAHVAAGVRGARALGLALAGRTHAAVEVVERVRARSPEPTSQPWFDALDLATAVAARELVDRDAASATLLRLAGRPTFPFPTLQLAAHLELVELTLSEGRVDEALERFLVAEALAEELGRARPTGLPARRTASGTWLVDRVSRTGVQVFLALDQPDRASEWSHRCHDPFWHPVSAARIHLARSEAVQAAESLSPARPRCVRHDVVLGLTWARALKDTDHRLALTHTEEALATAAHAGLLQTTASEGPHIQNLLELSAWRVPDAWMERLRRNLVPTWAGRATGPIEPLTEREREVLRLLPSRLTLGEIAAELFVSRNTLKFHMRAIYRKLGVESRRAAVESARALLLLPRGG